MREMVNSSRSYPWFAIRKPNGFNAVKALSLMVSNYLDRIFPQEAS